jgi:hypothetical protein
MLRWSTASEESGVLISGIELLSHILSRTPSPESAGIPERR